MKKLTTKKIILFAIGQLGWSILSDIIMNWLVYFYQPDNISQEIIPIFIPQGRIMLDVTTIIDLICILIFTSIANIDFSELGYRLTVACTAFFCLVRRLSLLLYNEKYVMKIVGGISYEGL